VERSAERLDLAALDVEERLNEHRAPGVTGVQAGDRLQPAAADQVQEHGLDLVVERVTLGDARRADLAPDVVRGVAPRNGRPRLDRRAAPWRVGRRAQMERDPVPLGESPHVGRVGGRALAQSMVVVEDLDADTEQPSQPEQRLEQAHRVGTAGDAREHEVAALEHRVLADRPRRALEDASDGWRSLQTAIGGIPIGVTVRRRARPSVLAA
jgi:hypothetical protein